MRKGVVIFLVLVVLVVGVSVYTCAIKGGGGTNTEDKTPVGGIYHGKVIAVGQSDSVTTIFFDSGQVIKVGGYYTFNIGQTYSVSTKETKTGMLEVISITIDNTP